jgi:IclR family acetate operon transcriptional repressor
MSFRDLCDVTASSVLSTSHDRPLQTTTLCASKKSRIVIDPFYTHDLSFHAHAAGKVWLATLPDTKVRELVGKPPFVAHTKYTKTTLAELMDDLKTCREVGYALSYEESELGVGTIAAAIMFKRAGGNPECVGVVSLAAPTARMDSEQLIACTPDLSRSALTAPVCVVIARW